MLTVGMATWLALLGLPTVAWAQQTSRPAYGPHMWDGGWHGWFFGPLMMIVFIAVVVIVVALVIRWLSGSRQGAHAQPYMPIGKTPLDILKERFAKGEIDKEEFEERRRVLGE